MQPSRYENCISTTIDIYAGRFFAQDILISLLDESPARGKD
jgi:hypothetical protein